MRGGVGHRTVLKDLRPETRLRKVQAHQVSGLERATGIEPVSSVWKTEVLPLHNARVMSCLYGGPWGICKCILP